MGLESPTWITDLVAANPVATDDKRQGDDHIRGIKTALRNGFPTSSKAWYNPDTVAKTANYSVLAADMNKTILVDTAAGAVTLTMPTLASGDAGWECSILKTNTGTNPCFIAPPSGTIQSGAITGLAKTRRCIPGVRSKVLWTGSAWIAERAVSVPVNSTLEFGGTSLPVGYEWPNGDTLTSASTNYPDFYVANGNSGVTLDDRDRVVAGKGNMGGVSANRLNDADDGLNGDTLGATGGGETQVLVTGNLPPYTPAFTDPGHSHPVTGGTTGGTGGGTRDSGVFNTPTTAAAITISSATTGIIMTTQGGTSTAFGIVQPTIIKNKILVVE